MSLPLPLAAIFLLGGVGRAAASTWTAPDSTRPAPWGARGAAPSVVIPWSAPTGGGAVSIDPDTGVPSWTDPGYAWDGGGDGGGGGGDGGGGGGDGGTGDGGAGCGGSDAGSAGGCGPGGDF